jgi:very-short-patch-repair endonuclease
VAGHADFRRFHGTYRPDGVVDYCDGRKFRRQHGIGYYVVDFCCLSEKLVIELDGDQHGDHEQIEKDKKRDGYLEGLGFTVLRFENKFVFRDQDYITEEIRKIFNKGDKLTTPAGDNDP